MLKWVVGLCVGLYLTMLIFGAPPENEVAAVSSDAMVTTDVAENTTLRTVDTGAETREISSAEANTQAIVDAGASASETAIETEATVETPVKLSATPMEVPVVVTETIEADAQTSTANRISDLVKTVKATPRDLGSTIELAAAAAATTVAPVATPEPSDGIGEIWTVTGSTVNLRAGAGTSFAVLGRTSRGDSAEVIELLENGWARVYVLENGVEAYMSARYLERETQ